MKTHEQKYVEYRHHPNISIYSLLQYRDLFPRQRPNSAWRGVGWRRLGGSWSPQSARCDRRRRNPSAPRSLIPARRKGRGTWGCRGWSILAAQKKGWCFMGFDEDIMKDIYIYIIYLGCRGGLYGYKHGIIATISFGFGAQRWLYIRLILIIPMAGGNWWVKVWYSWNILNGITNL